MYNARHLNKLTAVAELAFKALEDGDRIVSFVAAESSCLEGSSGGQEIDFIQERRQDDGSFHVVLPEATKKGSQYKLTIEYQGDNVLEDEGGGNFSVGARTSWYPSVNAFTDRATFDLTFKVSNSFVLVSVGKLAKESKEGDLAVSQWVSDVPLAVAGFNYGKFKRKDVTDETTKYLIEGYATQSFQLTCAERLRTEDVTGATIDNGLVEAQNSMRVSLTGSVRHLTGGSRLLSSRR